MCQELCHTLPKASRLLRPPMRQANSSSRRLRPSTIPRLDLVGAGLMAAAIAWTTWASTQTGTTSAGLRISALLAGGAFAFWGGRLLYRYEPFLVPLVVVAIATVLVLSAPEGIWTRAPRAGPWGYSSITGAFYTQAAIAALMLASQRWPMALRVLAGTAAIVFASVTVATTTWTAAVLVCLAVPMMVLSRRQPNGSQLAVAGCAGLFLIALAGSLVLGARYDFVDLGTKKANDASLEDSYSGLSERRVALWSDAIDIMMTNPLFGVGPDRFSAISPVVQTDKDEPWAHNDFLQLGAETGVLGYVLLVGVFLWAFLRLFSVDRSTTTTALGAVALTALGIHGSVEYIMHFPEVVLAGAALVGTGVGALPAKGGPAHRGGDGGRRPLAPSGTGNDHSPSERSA